MKIKGPSTPGAPGIEKPAATEPKAGTEGAFADKLKGAGGPGGPTGPKGPGPTDAVAQVHADLRAGTITPSQAVDKLMDLAVQRAGGAQLPDRVKAAIKSQLESFVAEDPYLASRARRLGVDTEE